MVLAVGLAASAAAGYLAALAATLVAIVLGAAPLGLAGESTPRQPWVTPVVVGAGLLVFGLGVWLSVRAFRLHRKQNDPGSDVLPHPPVAS